MYAHTPAGPSDDDASQHGPVLASGHDAIGLVEGQHHQTGGVHLPNVGRRPSLRYPPPPTKVPVNPLVSDPMGSLLLVSQCEVTKKD